MLTASYPMPPTWWRFDHEGLHDDIRAVSFLECVDRLWTLGGDHFHWPPSMVEKGVTSLQAITAATLDVARAYGRDDLLGSVEAGKLADFVLLDSYPLDDIRNLRAITAVDQAGAPSTATTCRPSQWSPLTPPRDTHHVSRAGRRDGIGADGVHSCGSR
ncbi:amidohydrolase family protein [Mycolicibacterium sp.]|uniref:amidohydrolase family protein n=1 Tax=Mycolicibacterium sp. TaxID=2320850 RepID=UPI003D0A7C31